MEDSMQSTAHVAGHPIHPMLIPYPFALLSAAAAFDIAAQVRDRPEWARTAQHLITVGVGTALVAALPGAVDYFGSVPDHSAAKRSATTHGLCNLSAVACFTAANRLRDPDRLLSRRGRRLSLLGTGLLAVAGYLGGELVY